MLATDPLVLAVHGSALPAAGATVGRLCDAVEARLGTRPTVGHLDHQLPSLKGALASGSVVVPLLLGDGYHRTVDIPAVVAAHGGGGCRLTPSLSGASEVDTALYERLCAAEREAGPGAVPGAEHAVGREAGWQAEREAGLQTWHEAERQAGREAERQAWREAERQAEREVGPKAEHAVGRGVGLKGGGPVDAIVFAAAGSSRPGGNGGALVAARRLAMRRPGTPMVVAYCSAAEPTVPEALARLRAAGHRRIGIVTHLLAPGRFTQALDAAGADLVTAPLADHPALASLVVRRYRAACRIAAVAA
ncbi:MULTISPECIES: sirohydrochlorin chelatase [unclassified Streptomyces]|uniref:sirohydrochlorin chelatase n=1 Tax=unclassified Streptomyces TaxID=2593676 RepID=UPI00278C49EF|nr:MULTISPECIES: CbiX/SirB N-terminal domain-containing protein [unclassified Streptomyces]